MYNREWNQNTKWAQSERVKVDGLGSRKRTITNVLFSDSLSKTVHFSSDRDIYDFGISDTDVDIQYFQFRYCTEIQKNIPFTNFEILETNLDMKIF